MKIIDEKGRLFKLINVVDLLVVITIILVIGGVAFALSDSGAITVSAKEYYKATIKCEAIEPSVFDYINEDDVFVYSNAFVNGYVKSKASSPAKIEHITEDLEIIYIDHPELLDITVDIIIEVDEGSTLIMLGKYQVNVGKDLVVKTSRVEINGTVISIEEYTK